VQARTTLNKDYTNAFSSPGPRHHLLLNFGLITSIFTEALLLRVPTLE
jgi:hypothetical protein